ncbi:Cytochrome P450 734A1 [Rhynchospora pubera]|uniref:Cytochrome P450 734A1 n=1 Tax=Rhynchospora pubera TaxID=906938 RepID=A0AAV8CLX0_9POAL|nr:Cytochrome P450 734A1 [Rhynchospora pubera]
MTKSMANCAQSMVEKWTDIITKAETERNQPVEMEVSSHFLEMTADVISHTAFGSNYMKGKEVFLAQKEQQMLLFKSLLKVPFPGYKYLPTKDNLYKRKLDKTVNDMLMQIINERFEKKEDGSGNDLLGLMLEACMQGGEENKTFFFAGHEATSHLLTWTMFLLGTNKTGKRSLEKRGYKRMWA